jgi:hypothetical protein
MLHKLILKGLFSPEQNAIARLQLTPTLEDSSDNDPFKLLVDWQPETKLDFLLFKGLFG